MVSCPSCDGRALRELPMAKYIDVRRTLSASSAVKATAQASVVRRRAHIVTLLLEAFGTRRLPFILHAGAFQTLW